MSAQPHEVVVVGARCAGSATALLLARQGHDVALVDRSPMPSDTLSTHAIARSGVVQLHRWGLLDEVLRSGAPAIRTVSFGTGGELAVRAVKPTAGVDHLVAPRRWALDTVLRDAAVAAGARLYCPATVAGLLHHPSGQVTGITIREGRGPVRSLGARLVVGADGLRSTVAGRVEAPQRSWCASPSGTFYTYVAGLDASGFEFHVAPRALVGVFPTHGGEACVWICAPASDLGPLLGAGNAKAEVLLGLVAGATPQLAARLRSALVTAPVRGAVNLPDQVRQPTGPGWALVGDAGYHRDPITGHGISDAFRDAELLADAVHDHLAHGLPWSLAGRAYDRSRETALREVLGLTQALARFPGVDRFVALQKQLSDAIERQSLRLAAGSADRSSLVPVA